jgi:O-antigen/teichoic acid export membrane protein
MGMVCIPMITSCKAILTLWLGIVPDYSVQFVQIVMVRILFSSFSQGIYITLNANAKIKTVQVVSSILSILTLVGAYILLRLKFEPYTVIVISAICEFCLLVYRLYYMNLTANISANGLVRYCSKAIIMITIFVFIAFYISAIVENMITSLLCMVITLALYITVTFFLLEDSQRSFIISKLKTTYNRLYKA